VTDSWPRHRVWATGIAISRNQSIDWSSLLSFRIADWYACGVFVPVLVWVTNRWPVLMSVRDDGPGPGGRGRPDGIGIANTRRRLEEMYAGAGSLTMTEPPGGGTLVEVRIPLKLASVVA
jgi:hypothetical protein